MRLSVSPDIFQEKMSELMTGLDFARAYLDDLFIISTEKELRCFIQMVNYYRDMWPLRSHLLAPLSSLTSAKIKWKCTTEHQEAYDKMKALIAKETLLIFPDFSEEFEIHTDASKLQLGACISQNGKLVAFYSRKLQPAQTRYTATEKRTIVDCRNSQRVLQCFTGTKN
jgi:hypothetical protein